MIETIKKFIENRGTVCPECGEEGIYATESLEGDAKEIVHSVRCLKCNSTWRNIFKIKEIYSSDVKIDTVTSCDYVCSKEHNCISCKDKVVKVDLDKLNTNGRKAVLSLQCPTCKTKWFVVYLLDRICDYRINGQAAFKVEVELIVEGDESDEVLNSYIEKTIKSQIKFKKEIKLVQEPTIKVQRKLL
jgi:DNA-directed RNA polymerase subunit M/transcription elongation factor TFIIS